MILLRHSVVLAVVQLSNETCNVCASFQDFSEVYLKSAKKKILELKNGRWIHWYLMTFLFLRHVELQLTGQRFTRATISLVGVFGNILGKTFTYLSHWAAYLGNSKFYQFFYDSIIKLQFFSTNNRFISKQPSERNLSGNFQA